MISFIDKYKKVVNHYNLDNSTLLDIATALCIADQNWGTNDKKLDINRLLSSVDVFNKQPKKTYAKLPDIQIKRVLVDTLILAIRKEGNDLSNELKLSSEAAHKVCTSCEVTGLSYLNYYDDATADDFIGKLIPLNTNVEWLECLTELINWGTQCNPVFYVSDFTLPLSCKSSINKVKLTYSDNISESEFTLNSYLVKLIGRLVDIYCTRTDDFMLAYASDMNIISTELYKVTKNRVPLYVTKSTYDNLVRHKVFYNSITRGFALSLDKVSLDIKSVVLLIYTLVGDSNKLDINNALAKANELESKYRNYLQLRRS